MQGKLKMQKFTKISFYKVSLKFPKDLIDIYFKISNRIIFSSTSEVS